MRPSVIFLAVLSGTLALQAQSAAWYQMQTFAGAGGIGDGGPASAALFLNLTGVAVDPSGNLYLADTDTHRIRRIAPNGIVTTFAGTGRPGLSGDGGPAAQAQLNFPYGIATDYAGNLYVADLGNKRIRRITADGRISTIAGHTPETRLIAPRNVAVDGPGQVYVADFAGHRVYRLAGASGLVPVAGTGRAGDAGDAGPATAALLSSPAGLAFDPAGNLYIGDTGNRRVRRVLLPTTRAIEGLPSSQFALPVTATGLAHTFAGELWIPDGAGGTLMRVAPQQPAFAFPFAAVDVAADFAGNVFAVRRNMIRRISPRTSAVTLIGGGTPFYFTGDGGPAFDSRMNRPGGLALDPSRGDIYLADSGNGRIRRINRAGVIETVLEGFTNPQGLAWDRRRNALLIADSGAHSVWIWRAGTIAQTVLAGGAGKAGAAGDGGPAATAELNRPTAVDVDEAGNVWISDTGNNRIRLVTSATGVISTAARHVQAPAGIVWDSRGFLYAAEPSTGRVHRIPRPGNSAATAPADFIQKPGSWARPTALALDFDGSLLVGDAEFHRVSRLTADGAVTVLAGTGEAGFDGDSPMPAVAAKFETPSAILADYSHLRILVADAGNHRIRSLEIADQPTTLLPPAQLVAPGATLANAASKLPASAVVPGATYALAAAGVSPQPGIEVTFDGLPAIRVMPPAPNTDIEWWIQVPADLNPAARETELVISRDGRAEIRQLIPIATAAPGLFPTVRNAADGAVNSADYPVTRGQSVLVRMTGEGSAAETLSVRIRGLEAAVLAVRRDVDGMAGITEVEVQVPGGYFPAGAFPLTVSSGPVAAANSLTVHVR